MPFRIAHRGHDKKVGERECGKAGKTEANYRLASKLLL
jgi:hypothetical protein